MESVAGKKDALRLKQKLQIYQTGAEHCVLQFVAGIKN